MGALKHRKAIFFFSWRWRYQLIKTTPETVNPWYSIPHSVLLPLIAAINPPILYFFGSFETLIIVGGPQRPDFCTPVLRSHPLMHRAHPRLSEGGKKPSNYYQYLARVRLSNWIEILWDKSWFLFFITSELSEKNKWAYGVSSPVTQE